MKKTFKQAFSGYRWLFNFKDYKISEMMIKSLFLVLVTPLFTILFIMTTFLYLLERLLSPGFKLFILFQMKMIQLKQFATPWMSRIYGLLSLVVTLVMLPFVMLYYLSMLLKALLKYMMKWLIIRLDYSIQTSMAALLLFDDTEMSAISPMASMFKDAQRSDQVTKMLESYFEKAALDDEEEDDIIQ